MLFSTVSFLVQLDVLVLGKEKIKLPGLKKEKAGGEKCSFLHVVGVRSAACSREGVDGSLSSWFLFAMLLCGCCSGFFCFMSCL